MFFTHTEGAESNSSSTQKTQVTEITFEDASTLNRYLPEEEEEEEVPVVNGGGGSKENLLEESDNAPETLCTGITTCLSNSRLQHLCLTHRQQSETVLRVRIVKFVSQARQ